MTITLRSRLVNPQQCHAWLTAAFAQLKPYLMAEHAFEVTIKPARRSEEASAKFHAICGDLERSKHPWFGKARTKAQWKVLLISGHAVATGEPADIIPGLESELVNIRESSALMDRARTSSLIEYALAYCAHNDVRLTAPEDAYA